MEVEVEAVSWGQQGSGWRELLSVVLGPGLVPGACALAWGFWAAKVPLVLSWEGLFSRSPARPRIG